MNDEGCSIEARRRSDMRLGVGVGVPGPGAGLLQEELCPHVEHIVRAEVKKFVYKSAGIGAGLIRLLFHDCFVQVTYARLPTMAMNAPRSKCFFDRTMDRCDTDTRRALMTHLYRDVTAPCSWTRRRRTRSRRS